MGDPQASADMHQSEVEKRSKHVERYGFGQKRNGKFSVDFQAIAGQRNADIGRSAERHIKVPSALKQKLVDPTKITVQKDPRSGGYLDDFDSSDSSDIPVGEQAKHNRKSNGEDTYRTSRARASAKNAKVRAANKRKEGCKNI